MFFEHLVLATGNQGKYREFAALLPKNIVGELVFSQGLNNTIHVEETGETYAVNALLKASAWAEATGLPALADDSGLEVDVLNGAPGVHSARIVPGVDQDRNEWLLAEIERANAKNNGSNKEQDENRKARFVAVLALAIPKKWTCIFEGECRGQIARVPSGKNGFGYDPLFIPDGFDRSFAEISPEVKNKISHRSNAICNMCAMLAMLHE